jgi:hypothetical protein
MSMPADNARLRRYAVIILVGGLHGLILFIVLTPHRSREVPDDDVSITMALYFPPPVETPAPPPRTRRPKVAVAAAPSAPAAPESMAPLAPPVPDGDARTSVDWMAEEETVAGAYAAKHGAVDAGAAARSGTATSAASPHHAGESYTLSTGQKIVWTSDSCYLISDPPDLATPNAFAHLAQARIGCQATSTSQGDLFKQSPTYQKYHPDN